MTNRSSHRSPSPQTLMAVAAGACLFLAAPTAGAQASPQAPRSIQPTPRPGELKSGQVDLVPVLDASTLVRFMTTEPVRVSPDGRTEAKFTVPASHCSGLAPGASREVRLPDVRWGVKNEVPRTVAGGQIAVADVKTPFQVVLNGVATDAEMVDRIGPGETRMFSTPRRGTERIQVTNLEVPARVRPTPPPTPNTSQGGGTTGFRVNPPPNPNDLAHFKCVSNVLVKDPAATVVVDFDGAVKETNETNNLKEF